MSHKEPISGMPKLMEIWDWSNNHVSPDEVNKGSKDTVWWVCPTCHGHYLQSPSAKVYKNAGCIYCSGKSVLAGYNDLLSTAPDIAKEWHPIKNEPVRPDAITPNSGKNIWWQCKLGHEWQATVSNRTRKHSGCPYCTGKKTIIGVNDLQTINPELAKQWHPTRNGEFTPEQVMCSSKKKIWWLCGKGHEWETTLDSRKRGHGCPYCSGRFAITGETDLQTLRPDIAQYWHPTKNGKITPSSVTVASGVKYWWLGTCGHEWETKVSTMCDKNTLSICPVCSSQNRTSFPEQAIFFYIQKAFPDCVSRYGAHKKELDIYIPSASIGIEYDGLRYHTQETEEKEKEKDEFFLSLGIQVFHMREHEDFETRIHGNSVMYRPWNQYTRLNKAIECLFKLIADYIGCPDFFADIDIERDNAEILSQYMKKRLDTGFAAKHPDILSEWHPTKNGDLDPWLISEKSNQKFWWLCSNGHEWRTTVNERTGHKTGCPQCYRDHRKHR